MRLDRASRYLVTVSQAVDYSKNQNVIAEGLQSLCCASVPHGLANLEQGRNIMLDEIDAHLAPPRALP